MNDSLKIVGLMSGTSMDGLDCCISEISINSRSLFNYNIIAEKSFYFDHSLKNRIKKAIGETRKNKINEINQFLGLKFLDLSKDFLSQHSFDYISMHGQTIYHHDRLESIQVADPSYFASFFNVPVIYNFRQKDIELGGTGAPLMPFLDWLLFKDKKKNVMTLNLGGISNISFIPKKSKKRDVVGFDTGPGMSLIDECVNRFWLEEYDKNGEYSSKGSINKPMLDYLVDNTPFIIESPPKSTGREEFGIKFLNKVIKKYSSVKKNDILRTLVKFTSVSIKSNIEQFILNKHLVDNLIVSGGGACHPILMDDIKKDLDIPILNIIDYGIESKIKESLLMSVLGYAKIKNIKSNMPNVTGASKDITLGEIYGPE